MGDLTKHYFISGRVQGVGFRAFTQKLGSELGLKGWVRNLADGRVETVAKGPSAVLLQFEQRLRRGPSRSTVEAVVAVELSSLVDNLVDFEVRKDAVQPWSEK